MFDREDETIERVAEELRHPVRLGPAFDDRVMARIRAGRPAAGGLVRARRQAGVWAWLVRPRTIRVSPLTGLAAAAAVAAVLLAGARRDGGERSQAGQVALAESVPAAPAVPVAHSTLAASRPPLVQFVLVAPEAHQVSLVGDFNDWDVAATRLRPASAGGVWTIEVPLAPGRHRYAFVVDGKRWLADPAAPRAVDDDFGTPSSVVTITERGA